MKQLRGVCVHEAVWLFGCFVVAVSYFLDDSLDDETACEPAEECTAYKSDQDVDIPGERTLHDDSSKPAANSCNNKRNNKPIISLRKLDAYIIYDLCGLICCKSAGARTLFQIIVKCPRNHVPAWTFGAIFNLYTSNRCFLGHIYENRICVREWPHFQGHKS